MQIPTEFIKEIKRTIRDHIAFIFQIIYPIVIIGIIGISLSEGESELFEENKIVIVDLDNSSYSNKTIFLFKDYIKDTEMYGSIDSAKEVMKKGEISAIIVIPEDYEKEIELVSKKVTIEVYVDNSVIASDYSVRYVIERVQNNITNQLLEEYLNPPGVEIETHNAYGEVRYIDKITPGLIITSILLTGIIGTILSISKERESGLLYRIATTPAKKYNIIIGKILANTFIVILQSAILILFAYFVFAVPINGSIYGLIFLCILTAFFSVSIGITISALTKSTNQALYGAMLVNIPLAFFCGQFWPVDFMPHFAQSIAELIPITMAVSDIRGIMIRGTNFSTTLFTLSYLTISAIAISIIGSLLFSLKKDE